MVKPAHVDEEWGTTLPSLVDKTCDSWPSTRAALPYVTGTQWFYARTEIASFESTIIIFVLFSLQSFVQVLFSISLSCSYNCPKRN